MISSINTGMSMPPPRAEIQLSAEQQKVIADTLAELDADNLTEEEAITIVDAFSEAGIQPGKSMQDAVSELGFDAKTIGDLANVEAQGTPPPPPPQANSEASAMVDFLGELLEERLAAIDGEELSEQDMQSIYAQVMNKFGIEEGDSIINTTA